ncbi:MAG: hypothetical protein KAS39_07605, partial [Actinomycetia bacterium]|nr:hypothetical protein [Actinomycetes bacterium]
MVGMVNLISKSFSQKRIMALILLFAFLTIISSSAPKALSSFRLRNSPSLTRAKFAINLANRIGLDPYYPDQKTFLDVNPKKYYYPYIEALVKAGIIIPEEHIKESYNVKAKKELLTNSTNKNYLFNPTHLITIEDEEKWLERAAKFLDKTPPETNMEATPTSPDGLLDFFITTPFVKLLSNEVGTTYYQFNSTDENSFLIYEGNQINIPEGINTLYYYSIDNYNNKEEIKEATFKVDSINPVSQVFSPAKNDVVDGPTEVKGTATDEFINYYTLDLGKGDAPATWQNIAIIFNTNITDNVLSDLTDEGLSGDHSLRLRVFDEAGNSSQDLIYPVVFDNGPPDTPESLKVLAANLKNNISFDSSTEWDVPSYNIYRSGEKEGVYELIANIENTSYEDP